MDNSGITPHNLSTATSAPLQAFLHFSTNPQHLLLRLLYLFSTRIHRKTVRRPHKAPSERNTYAHHTREERPHLCAADCQQGALHQAANPHSLRHLYDGKGRTTRTPVHELRAGLYRYDPRRDSYGRHSSSARQVPHRIRTQTALRGSLHRHGEFRRSRRHQIRYGAFYPAHDGDDRLSCTSTYGRNTAIYHQRSYTCTSCQEICIRLSTRGTA